MISRIVGLFGAATLPALLGLLVGACSGVPPVGGGAGGAGGSGGGVPADVSPPDRPCAFVATPAAPTSNPSCPQGTYAGNVSVDGPEDVAALAGCTRIAGNMSIGGSNLQSLRGLESLRAVDGQLGILVGAYPCPPGSDPRRCIGLPSSPLLTSVRGLDELRCVGGDMTLVTSSPPLIDAGGLAKLSDVEGSLTVLSAGLLVQPLPALTRVYGDVLVPGSNVVPALTTVYGNARTPAGPVQPGAFPRLSYVGCGSSYAPCRDGVLGCEFDATDQSAVQSLSACTYAFDNLKLSGAAVTDTSPLQRLRQVRGIFSVEGTGLPNLSGLADLDRVGALVVTDNSALADVEALDGLTLGYSGKNFPGLVEPNGAVNEFGGLKIQNNAALTRLGLPNVRVAGIAPTIKIIDNPALATLGNWPWLTDVWELRIQGSPLSSLAGLQALKTTRSLLLADLPNVSSLTGLQNLEQVSDSIIIERAGVTNLDALSKIREVERLQIGSCHALTSISGLRSLTTATDGVFLIDAPALTSLQGLDALQTAQNVMVTGAGIANLAGLGNLASAYRLYFDACPRLTSLSGVGRLTELQELSLLHLPVFSSLAAVSPVSTIVALKIEDVPGLTGLDGLSLAPTAYVVDLVRVPSLRSLRGLERVRELNSLHLDDAGSLETLEGLGGLESAGEFTVRRTAVQSLRALVKLTYLPNGPAITQNPRLSDCELRWLFERVGFTPSQPLENYSNAGPRNCELTAPVTTPGLVWSKFFDQADEGPDAVHLLPDGRLALPVAMMGQGIFTPPPGAPPAARPPADTTAVALRLLRWDGSPLSTRRLGDFSGSSQETRCSNVDASGRINVVVHENFQEAPHQSAQFRFAADGSLLAEQRQPAPDYDTRCALDATANTYYVDGPSGVTKRDAAGNVLWEKRFEAPPELGETTWATPHSSSSGLVLQFASSPPGNTALVRVLEDGRVAWTRIVRGALSEYILRVVIAADGLVTVWGASESAVSADGSSTVLPLPAGSSQLPFLLRLRDDGSVASLRVFPDPMRNGRITLGPDGSLYVVSDGADTPSTPAAFYKFDVSGNLVFKRDLGPLLAGWTGTRQFYSVGLSARADRVVLAARTLNTSGFLAQFTP